MKKHLRVFAIVVSILAIGCGTASAYDKNTQSVLLDMDGVPRMVTTDKTTVGELMDDLAENVETEYIVTNAEESDVLEDNMELTLTSVTEKTVSTTKTVPYETVERTNNNLKSGESRVVQEGVNGTATVINKEIYHGTELVETLSVEEKVVTEPVDKIVEVGVTIDDIFGAYFHDFIYGFGNTIFFYENGFYQFCACLLYTSCVVALNLSRQWSLLS